MHRSWDKNAYRNYTRLIIDWKIRHQNIEIIAHAHAEILKDTSKLGGAPRTRSTGEMWWWLLPGILTVVVLVLYLFSLRRTYCIKGKHIVVRLPAGLSGMRVEVPALEA